MHTKLLPALLFSLLVFALSCDSCDDDDDDEITLPSFTGITLTDNLGQSLGTPDATDWRVDDSWEQVEKDLFDLPTSTLCSSDGAVSPGYPNPCEDFFGFRFVSSTNSIGFFRLVDRDFNVLMKRDSALLDAGGDIILLNFSEINPDTVRLYYRIVSGACEYRGHGDVIVQ